MGVLGRQGEEPRDQRDAPALEQEQVARHSIGGGLDELEVLVFVGVSDIVFDVAEL